MDHGKELLMTCLTAQRERADFPTVWNRVLNGSRLVVGKPIQQMEADGQVVLAVNLTTGQRILYGSGRYSIR